MRKHRTKQEPNKPGDLKAPVAVLLGLLVLAAALLLMARSDSTAFPSVANTGPSGLAAFAELLRRDGYVVVQNRDEKPSFLPSDLVVGIELPRDTDNFWADPERPEESKAMGAVTKHAGEGGSVLVFSGATDFDATSREAALPTKVISRVLKREALVNCASVEVAPDYSDVDGTDGGHGPETYSLWTTDPKMQAFVAVSRRQNGIEADATLVGATNRFVGRNQNAEVYLDLVRRLAPAGSRVVFAESTFGNAEHKGLLGKIGGWAVAAQWQALLLVLVVVLALGKRFGLPESDPMVQRGTRDLVDAVASAMRRGHKSGYALGSLVDAASEQTRATLRLPQSMPRKELWQRLPDGLSSALVEALHLSEEEPKLRTAVKAAQRVLRELQAFERDHRERSA